MTAPQRRSARRRSRTRRDACRPARQSPDDLLERIGVVRVRRRHPGEMVEHGLAVHKDRRRPVMLANLGHRPHQLRRASSRFPSKPWLLHSSCFARPGAGPSAATAAAPNAEVMRRVTWRAFIQHALEQLRPRMRRARPRLCDGPSPSAPADRGQVQPAPRLRVDLEGVQARAYGVPVLSSLNVADAVGELRKEPAPSLSAAVALSVLASLRPRPRPGRDGRRAIRRGSRTW